MPLDIPHALFVVVIVQLGNSYTSTSTSFAAVHPLLSIIVNSNKSDPELIKSAPVTTGFCAVDENPNWPVHCQVMASPPFSKSRMSSPAQIALSVIIDDVGSS